MCVCVCVRACVLTGGFRIKLIQVTALVLKEEVAFNVLIFQFPWIHSFRIAHNLEA